LFDPACFGTHARKYEGREYVVPHFLFQSHQIWGATCMILGELATVMSGEDLWLMIEDCWFIMDYVILSVAKELFSVRTRSFAVLRMTCY